MSESNASAPIPLRSDTGPFAIVPEWLIYEAISDRAVRLYATLARYADAEGLCWPSRQTLAKRTRCSVASIDRAAAELERLGAIHRQHRTDEAGDPTTNLWTVYRLPPGERGSRGGEATPSRGAEATGSRGADAQNENQREREKDRAREPFEDDFDSVWETYPRKDARKGALRAYQARRREGVPAPDLARAVEHYATVRAREDPQFTMLGATFFGPNERWRDSLDPPRPPARPGSVHDQVAEHDRRSGRSS